jgi:TrmH family RNA methyltransferase
VELSSTKNPRVLATAELFASRRARDEQGLAVVEGTREIGRALACGFEARELFVCGEVLAPEAAALLAHPSARRATRYEVTRAVFGRLAMREGSAGLVAVVAQRVLGLEALPLAGVPLLAAAQGIEKPGNLGALVRAADGAGADAVVALDGSVDPWNPNAIRASVGTVFRVPVVSVTSAELRAFCRSRGLRTVAAALSARAVPHSSQDLRGPTAIVLGAEDRGLTADWLEDADALVTIPMRGIADSLNVAAAGAVLLYEVLRQRGTA